MTLTLERALAADAAGDRTLMHDAREVILAAARDTPQDLPLALRAVNHLAFTGGPRADVTALIDELLAANPLTEHLCEQFILPSVSILLEAASWWEAWELLGRVPESLRGPLWEALALEHKRFCLILDHRSAPVSWDRLASDWWTMPPTVLPATHEGRPLSQWLAGNVTVREGDELVAEAAGADPDNPQRLEYYSLTPSYADWLSMGGQQLPEGDPPYGELRDDRFFELGVYGEDITIVRMAPNPGITRAMPAAWPARNRYLQGRSL